MNPSHTVPICWNPNFSVGVEVLDQHHQELASIINKLGECSDESAKSEKMVDILTALVSYAEYHFRHEEHLMAAANYDNLEVHQLEHRHFCEIVAETCYGATLGVIGAKDLFNYLSRWWKNHILLEDMKYKPYLSTAAVLEPA